MDTCPPREQLEQFQFENLGVEEQAAIEAHVGHCTACQQALSYIHAGATRIESMDQSSEAVLPESDIPEELRNHPRYEVLEVLGHGGMGTVYRARHRILERSVVLKVIRPELLGNPGMVARFQREAQLAARLTHPNVVAVYEAEALNASQLLIMEFIEGLDLANLVSQRGVLPVAESCELIRQTAMGLQHIHEQNLVHRDIKPANLLVSHEGIVKVLDLGLATLKGGQTQHGDLTVDGQFLGTVDYASPEQWQNTREIGIASDIYSLGCSFFFLLAGQPPFPRESFDTVMQQMWAHGNTPLPRISELRDDVPVQIKAILERMTAKNVTDRFQTPAEVAEALEPFVEGCDLAEFVQTTRRTTTSSLDLAQVGSSVRETTVAGHSKTVLSNPVSRRRLGVVVGSVIAVLVGVLLVAFLTSGGRVKEPTEDVLEPDTDSGSVVQDVDLSPIKVGILHSRSGTMAISERPVIDATQFAIQQINDAGGVLGRPIEAIVEDGESDWPTFAEKAEKLIIEDKVCTIFGCWTSASRKTVLPVLQRHSHLMFYPVQYEGLEESPHIVYVGASPNQQIVPAVKWCKAVLKKTRFFLIGSDYVFPRCANAIISDVVAAEGGEVVGEEYLLLGALDATQVVQKIVDAKPDVILNSINGDTNVSFFRALRAAGVKSEKVPTLSFSISEQELGNLSTKHIVGDYAAWNYFQTVDRPQNHRFLQQFREHHGAQQVVSDPMECAFTAVHLWAAAVEAAGSADTSAIRQSIGQQRFDGPGGEVRVDTTTQHVSKVFRVGRITSDGLFEVIYSSDSPVAPMPYPPTRSRAAWDAFLLDLNLGWGGQWANPQTL